MTKVSRKPFPDQKTGKFIEEFWRAVTLLETKDEVRAFSRDILTHTERQMLAKRLQIAKLLHQGADYVYIKKEVGVSDTTIGTVSRWLHEVGDGYRIAIERLLASSKKKGKLPRLWKWDPAAQLLVGVAALGVRSAYGKYKKVKKRGSASK
ncbi:MAG: hypothetical protein COT91_03255 [Candidatus Doudnabacteria bacterium CG10_big_fil_rev_8_21_14_0_10_41_10]|uniref:TrpR like protein, YerC/YecD n=1 Tax=Candidatus Doudnabacteria bacterium CG10_big_fil_rev_8_21_14_0_10_41_10 TaxID=1974551 RepID=A0A2H0VD92_9BACT|nr:MAG: hypothetical protein COT91_03255 [Candidatus Doudnabacteria bacterium CG10_big_fil_rev_8_21_14_0_10_41_10]